MADEDLSLSSSINFWSSEVYVYVCVMLTSIVTQILRIYCLEVETVVI